MLAPDQLLMVILRPRHLTEITAWSATQNLTIPTLQQRVQHALLQNLVLPQQERAFTPHNTTASDPRAAASRPAEPSHLPFSKGLHLIQLLWSLPRPFLLIRNKLSSSSCGFFQGVSCNELFISCCGFFHATFLYLQRGFNQQLWTHSRLYFVICNNLFIICCGFSKAPSFQLHLTFAKSSAVDSLKASLCSFTEPFLPATYRSFQFICNELLISCCFKVSSVQLQRPFFSSLSQLMWILSRLLFLHLQQALHHLQWIL